MSNHNLCFRAKIRKNTYPCTPQFHYIKVGCKGVFITRTCYHDELFTLMFASSIGHVSIFEVLDWARHKITWSAEQAS